MISSCREEREEASEVVSDPCWTGAAHLHQHVSQLGAQRRCGWDHRKGRRCLYAWKQTHSSHLSSYTLIQKLHSKLKNTELTNSHAYFSKPHFDKLPKHVLPSEISSRSVLLTACRRLRCVTRSSWWRMCWLDSVRTPSLWPSCRRGRSQREWTRCAWRSTCPTRTLRSVQLPTLLRETIRAKAFYLKQTQAFNR